MDISAKSQEKENKQKQLKLKVERATETQLCEIRGYIPE